MQARWFWIAAAIVLGAASVPACAAWHQAQTRHFLVYADLRPDELRRFVERLERFDRAVRSVRRMQDPPLTQSNRLTVFVVNHLSGIERLAGSYDVAGFYLPRASGSVAFVPRKAGSKYSKWDLDAEPVFFHEYAHHLQLQFANVALPLWVTEGFAEFFAPTELRDDGTVVIGAVPTYRAPALFSLSALSIHEMLAADSRYDDTEFIETYGRGWLLTHYLTFDRSRKGQFDQYVAAIQSGTKPLDAARSAFGDLQRLNRQLSEYLRLKKLPHLMLGRIDVPPSSIQLRPLLPAEAAMLPIHMRSKSGTSRRTAGRLAKDARKIAASYPNDAFVQAALAEAEFDAGNYAAAESAADRALAVSPAHLQSLIYKGRSRMELARAGGVAADWGEIRSWFLKANKADAEAAEPLLEFYRSYLHAGVQPTRNAVKGLLYAVAIAPRDDQLRVVAVRQLLVENRIAEARQYFAPFSFAPHSQRTLRDASDKVIAALDTGDRNAAIANLTRVESLLKKGD